jgi:ankyrin repeat protein
MTEPLILHNDPCKYDARQFAQEHSATRPAHVAVFNDDLNALRALHAAHGVAALSTHLESIIQFTPLALAVVLHRRAVVALLLALGVPVGDSFAMAYKSGDAVVFGNASALQLAAWRGDVALMDTLFATAPPDSNNPLANNVPQPKYAYFASSVAIVGHSLCYYAAHNADPAVLSMLIDRGFDFRSAGVTGANPMHAAAVNPNPALIDLLLAAGGDVTQCDLKAVSPLHAAARHNSNEKVVATLLAAGASVTDRTFYKQTPVHCAAMNPNVAVMAELLKHCSADDVNVLDSQNMTPCNLARSRDVLAALLAHGGEFGALDTALLMAVENGNELATQRLLLKLTVDVNKRGRDGLTLLHRAARVNSGEIVQMLLDAGLNKDERCELHERTALHYAAGSHRDAGALRVLVAAGADLYAADKESLTALHCACASDNMAALEVFANVGIDVVEAAKSDVSLVCSAARASEAKVLRHLMRHGVDFRARNRIGQTPCIGASVRSLDRMFAAGANLDFAHNAGTSLNGYSIFERPFLTLLAAGADVGSFLTAQVASISAITTALLCACGRVEESAVKHIVGPDMIVKAVEKIAQRQFEMMRFRAFEVLVGLQPLGLSALVTCEILAFTFAPRESLIAFHRLWAMATLAKHFQVASKVSSSEE